MQINQITKCITQVIAGISLALLIAAAYLEFSHEPHEKLNFKVVSYCDFNKGVFSIKKLVYEYWKFRDVQVKDIENKDFAVHYLLMVSVFGDTSCNAMAFEELRKMKEQGYDFAALIGDTGRTWLQREVLIGEPVTVNWLLALDGFVNTTVVEDGSPYDGEDIFQLANSLYKKEPTARRARIVKLLERFK